MEWDEPKRGLVWDFREPNLFGYTGSDYLRGIEERRLKLLELQKRILAAARGDVFELVFTEDSTGKTHRIKVPRTPFETWALSFHRTVPLQHLVPAWETVSACGWKMMWDDQVHTDWWVGAGLDPSQAYDYEATEGLRQALYDEVDRVLAKYAVTSCAVLARGPRALGPVWHAVRGETCPPGSVAVVPAASVNWWDEIQGAAAVIAEQGGEMSHLATVGRERGIPVVRVTGARKRYPVGVRVSVDTEAGAVDANYSMPAED